MNQRDKNQLVFSHFFVSFQSSTILCFLSQKQFYPTFPQPYPSTILLLPSLTITLLILSSKTLWGVRRSRKIKAADNERTGYRYSFKIIDKAAFRRTSEPIQLDREISERATACGFCAIETWYVSNSFFSCPIRCTSLWNILPLSSYPEMS